MPKKTRREKHAADAHRLNVSQNPGQVTYQFASKSFSFNHAAAISIPDTDLSVIKHDLGKTVILAGIAIVAEIVLSRVIH